MIKVDHSIGVGWKLVLEAILDAMKKYSRQFKVTIILHLYVYLCACVYFCACVYLRAYVCVHTHPRVLCSIKCVHAYCIWKFVGVNKLKMVTSFAMYTTWNLNNFYDHVTCYTPSTAALLELHDILYKNEVIQYLSHFTI